MHIGDVLISLVPLITINTNINLGISSHLKLKLRKRNKWIRFDQYIVNDASSGTSLKLNVIQWRDGEINLLPSVSQRCIK